jgi:hypothetical protein
MPCTTRFEHTIAEASSSSNRASGHTVLSVASALSSVTGNSGGDGFTPSSAPLLGDDPAGAARSIFAYHLYYTNKVNGHMGGYRGQVQTRFKQAKRMGVGTIVGRRCALPSNICSRRSHR